MSSTAAPAVLAEGIGFTEGPLWTTDRRLLVASVSRGHVYEVGLGGAPPALVADLGGAPSGLAEDADGVVWAAQGGSHLRAPADVAFVPPALQRLAAAGASSVATEPLHAPNDLVVGPDGRVWLTDPRGPAMGGDPEPGSIWAFDPAAGSLARVAEGALFPNGLAFAPDDRVLYVAETATARVLRYERRDELLGEPEIFLSLPEGRPDGLAVDAVGNLLIAATTAHAVFVAAADGTLVERIELPAGSMPTNLCFAGDDLATLVVTTPRGGRVIGLRREVPGLPLPPFRS